MTQKRICYSLNEKKVAQIAGIAAKKGLPVSEIAERLIGSGLSRSPELTAVERYHFQRDGIIKSLDNLLRLFGITGCEGGCTDKFRLLLYACHGNNVLKNAEFRKGIVELSLFDVLNDIKDWDIAIWKKLTKEMRYFGRIRERYFNLYPK